MAEHKTHEGRRYIVFGVANQFSICWGIAQKLRERGAEVVLVCQPTLRDRVAKFATGAGIEHVLSWDVAVEVSTTTCFDALAQLGTFDGFVHGIAFSNKDELAGRFINTSRDNFATTMLVSCYSFIEMTRQAPRLVKQGGSIVTLTFDGSQGPYPNYNIMGVAKAALESAVLYAACDLGAEDIRVNAISASPTSTLSARGIQNFPLILGWAASTSPLGRTATVAEIAGEAAYLLGPDSTGVTGQIRFVDCGSGVPNLPPIRNMKGLHGALGRMVEEADKSGSA